MGNRLFSLKHLRKLNMISLLLFVFPLISGSPEPYSYDNHKVVPFVNTGRFHYSGLTSRYRSYTAPSFRAGYPTSYSTNSVETQDSTPAKLTPITKALSSYIAESGELDDCGELSKAYIQSILSGSSAAAAAQSASKLYISNYRPSRTRGLSPACQAAETAYRSAYYAGLDPVLPAARAYLEASGSSSPCSAAATAYIQAFSEGREAGAFLAAAKAFSSQFSVQPSLDPACTKAALAANSDSSSPTSAALRAFIEKSEEVGSNGNDPVCAASAESFIQSYISGVDEETIPLGAARTFLSLYSNNNQDAETAKTSPCTAAAKAYALALASESSKPTSAALLAFIDKAEEVGGGNDPVCAKSADTFIQSFLRGVDEDTIGLEAAKTFISLYSSNPSPAKNSPCTAAAQAYAKSLGSSDATNSALVAYLTAATESNSLGLEPVCAAAAEAYIDSLLAGQSEEAADEAAAVAYVAALDSNPGARDTESPCSRAAEAYIANYEK